MVCPSCRARRGRRACPALGQVICSVCCGTKRQVEIDCPADCPYLSSAREHPPATLLRQRERDGQAIFQLVDGFNTRQMELFSQIAGLLRDYAPEGVERLIDDDVLGAVVSLAATHETAARGLIYEHRPASRPAERLAGTLRPLIDDVGRHGGTVFEREASLVLRRFEQGVTQARAAESTNPRAFVEFLVRVTKWRDEETAPTGGEDDRPRLIVP